MLFFSLSECICCGTGMSDSRKRFFWPTANLIKTWSHFMFNMENWQQQDRAMKHFVSISYLHPKVLLRIEGTWRMHTRHGFQYHAAVRKRSNNLIHLNYERCPSGARFSFYLFSHTLCFCSSESHLKNKILAPLFFTLCFT